MPNSDVGIFFFVYISDLKSKHTDFMHLFHIVHLSFFKKFPTSSSNKSLPSFKIGNKRKFEGRPTVVYCQLFIVLVK